MNRLKMGDNVVLAMEPAYAAVRTIFATLDRTGEGWTFGVLFGVASEVAFGAVHIVADCADVGLGVDILTPCIRGQLEKKNLLDVPNASTHSAGD